MMCKCVSSNFATAFEQFKPYITKFHQNLGTNSSISSGSFESESKCFQMHLSFQPVSAELRLCSKTADPDELWGGFGFTVNVLFKPEIWWDEA